MQTESVKSLIDFFNNGLKLRPLCPAIKFDDGHTIAAMSYVAINDEADRMCFKLKTLDLEDTVVSASSRKHASVVSIIIGILKVPAAFTFVDFEGLPSTISSTLNSLGSKYIFILENEIELLRRVFVNSLKIWETETNAGKLLLFEITDIEKKKYPYHDWKLAYAIQTSGSTGVPKIVKVPHRCIIPNILHMRNLYRVTSDDLIFVTSPLTFDPYIVDLFMAFSCGACILFIPDRLKFIPKKLTEMIYVRNSATMIQATPALLRNVSTDELRKYLLGPSSSLRILGLGGEQCPDKSTLLTWKSPLNKTEIYNVYGITEVSCWASIHRVDLEKDSENEIPLGETITGTEFQIMDSDGQVITSGQGHLYIGGSERVCFIDWEDDSEATKAPMRPSGDLVRLNTDGQIFYIERLDDVVKRYGTKISLNQITQAANSLPEIETSHALFNEKKFHLILAIIIKTSHNTESQSVKDKLKEHIQKNLPKSSVPDLIVVVDSFPVTSHGKIDKRVLMSKAYTENFSDDKSYDEIYNNLTELWRTRLGICHAISPSNSLISLGGDSHVAIGIVEEIKVRLGIECPLLLDKLLTESLHEVCLYLEDVKKNEKHPPFIYSSSLDSEHYLNSDSSYSIPVIGETPDMDYNNVRRISRGNALYTLKITHLNDSGPPLKSFELCWKYNTTKCVDASPLILSTPQDEIVCIGSHSHIFSAISLQTGLEKWVFLAKDRIESSACASPCGRKIFVGSYDCHLYCLDSFTGQQLWKFKAQGIIKTSPTVDAITNFVYFGSYDHCIYALLIDSGTCVWKCELGTGSVFSSPCLSPTPHHLYEGTLDGTLAALSPVSGHLIWKHNLKSAIFSSCALTPQGICVGCVDYWVYSFDHYGNKLWSFAAAGAIFSSPSMATMACNAECILLMVIGAHDNHVYCLNAETGVMRWKVQLSSAVYSTSFIHSVHAAGSKSTPYVFVCSTNGTLYALSLNEGAVCAEYHFDGEVFSSPVVIRNKVQFNEGGALTS